MRPRWGSSPVPDSDKPTAHDLPVLVLVLVKTCAQGPLSVQAARGCLHAEALGSLVVGGVRIPYLGLNAHRIMTSISHDEDQGIVYP